MTNVEWRCHLCRARGSIDVRADATPTQIAEMVRLEHSIVQPKCDGHATPIQQFPHGAPLKERRAT